MLSPGEQHEIRSLIYAELAALEARVAHAAGSYNYLCLIGGMPCFTHTPVGAVLRTIPHVKKGQVQ